MPTKSELEAEIKKLNEHVHGLKSELSLLWTETLAFAFQIQNEEKTPADLIEFLNPDNREIFEIKEQIKMKQSQIDQFITGGKNQ